VNQSDISNGLRDFLSTNTEQPDFERLLLQKQQLKPFHMDCPVTLKPICRCAHSKTPLEELERTLNRNTKRKCQGLQTDPGTESAKAAFQIAFDMHLYYSGFAPDLQQKLYARR